MTDQIQIERVAVKTMFVPIRGTAPLIVSNFSEKAKRQMLEAQQGNKAMKENRDPDAEYEAAFYRVAREDAVDGYGFPSVGFKSATISAARFYSNLKMTELRQFLFFKGTLTKADPQMLVEIQGEPSMREDVVRLAGAARTAYLRFRPQFIEWSAMLEVQFVHNKLNQSSVVSLIEAGGLGVGVGEWRPERKGEFGTFEVDPDREVTVIG
jgi:hypothetical protein